MGAGDPDPTLENYKAFGLLSNTDLDPLENHKATIPVFNVGPFTVRHLRADDGSLLVDSLSY